MKKLKMSHSLDFVKLRPQTLYCLGDPCGVWTSVSRPRSCGTLHPHNET